MKQVKLPTQMRTHLGKCLNCKKAGVGKIYDEAHQTYKLMCKFCKWQHLPNDADLGALFTNALGEFI